MRPHVVVTLNQNGLYGHPDHIAICQHATAAIAAVYCRGCLAGVPLSPAYSRDFYYALR